MPRLWHCFVYLGRPLIPNSFQTKAGKMVIVSWCYCASDLETCLAILAAVLMYRLFRCYLFVIFLALFSSTFGFISLWIVTERIFRKDRHCQGRQWCWAPREHNETEIQGKDMTRWRGAISPWGSYLRAQAGTLLIEKTRLIFQILEVLFHLFSRFRKAGGTENI